MLISSIIFAVISLVTTFLFVYNEQLYLKIYKFDQFISVFYMILYYLLIIVYLVWLYKAHKDLVELNTMYPITPKGALARVMIPIYSLWGMWNVYSTMYDHFRPIKSTEKLGSQLKVFIPFYYFLFLITNGLNRVLLKSNTGLYEVSDILYLVSYSLDLILLFVFLKMVNIVMKALDLLMVVKQDIIDDTQDVSGQPKVSS